MKLVFVMINMNLGGTEKSFLNLVDNLEGKYDIDLLLLEKKGELLSQLPKSINIYEIPNSNVINEYLRLGPRVFGIDSFKKKQFIFSIRCFVQFFLTRYKIIKNPFWAISKFIKPIFGTYDYAISYAGIHDFLSFYVLTEINAKVKYQWIHFDVNKVIANTNFGKKFYQKFDKIFCVSENAKDAFDKMFPKVTDRSDVFKNIIPHDLIKQQAKVTDGFDDGFEGLRLVTLGRLSVEKGQQMIAEVVSKLKNLNISFRWYLIGDGKLRQEIEKSIDAFGIAEDLVLLGSIINPYKYLQECDIYVQTSLHEGYCITLHEAKVFNKPVVTTNFLSASNIIKNKEEGLIVDISVEGLYEGVRKMILDDNLRVYCSKNFLVRDRSAEIHKLFV